MTTGFVTRRGGAKWSGAGDAVLPASVADMELAVWPALRAAGRAALDAAPGYLAPDELRAVLEAADAWWDTHHGLRLPPDSSVAGSSIAVTSAWALHRLTAPGDGVVRLRPTYPPLVSAVRDAGRRDLPVDLVRDGGRWTLDLEALDAAAADATALVWVSPQNPTGRAFDEAEVAAVAEIAARHALVVLSDEIWADVLLGATVHVPFARVARDVDVALAERTVTMVGTSKAFNVAQVGAAVTHGGSAVFDRLRGRGRLGLAPPAGRVEQAVATEAWRNGRTWLDGTLATLTAARDAAAPVLVDAFGADRVTLPDATYLAWVDVRGTALEGLDPGRVAAACGIVPTAGADYEAPGFVRLNLGCDPATAAELAGRLAAGARG